MNDLDAARALISGKPNRQKVALLAALTEWADSESGCEYRASLAHGRCTLNPITAEDVLALLDEETAASLRYDLGVGEALPMPHAKL